MSNHITWLLESNKNTIRVLWWVARKYWVATVLAMMMVFVELFGFIRPEGSGWMFVLGWLFMYMSVAYSVDSQCKRFLFKKYLREIDVYTEEQ